MGPGPRRMDGSMGGGRPMGSTGRPMAPNAGRRPMPAPVQRPLARPAGAGQHTRPQQSGMRPQPAQRPQQPYAPQGGRVAAPVQPQPAARQAVVQESVSKGGGWKVLVQFVAGLLVIAGVAAAIVTLYIKYYSTS